LRATFGALHIRRLTAAMIRRKQDSGEDHAMNKADNDQPQLSLGEIVTKLPAVRTARKVNVNSHVHRRLITPIGDDDEIAFQHTVFCQTSFPYRNPGDDVREWKRRQGAVSLLVEAGQAQHPKTGEWVKLGLPWGTKPRLILAHLNAEAIKRQSAEIEVESSLSAFVQRIRGFKHGREIRMFKDQLSRLSVALVRLATTRGDRAFQINSPVVTAFELWPELDERQRVLWPATIRLSSDYFNSLQQHAVPLNEADLAALAHSALAIDLYCWLAQRLHRVTPTKPVFITWAALKEQFGPDYGRMDNFKRIFRIAFRQVRARYQRAIIELDDRGMTLHHSLPPVTKRLVQAKQLAAHPNPDHANRNPAG
jgi:Plasmid encoded RepA protein